MQPRLERNEALNEQIVAAEMQARQSSGSMPAHDLSDSQNYWFSISLERATGAHRSSPLEGLFLAVSQTFACWKFPSKSL